MKEITSLKKLLGVAPALLLAPSLAAKEPTLPPVDTKTEFQKEANRQIEAARCFFGSPEFTTGMSLLAVLACTIGIGYHIHQNVKEDSGIERE